MDSQPRSSAGHSAPSSPSAFARSCRRPKATGIPTTAMHLRPAIRLEAESNRRGRPLRAPPRHQAQAWGALAWAPMERRSSFGSGRKWLSPVGDMLTHASPGLAIRSPSTPTVTGIPPCLGPLSGIRLRRRSRSYQAPLIPNRMDLRGRFATSSHNLNL